MRAAITTTFKVFVMIRPGIKPRRSSAFEADDLPLHVPTEAILFVIQLHETSSVVHQLIAWSLHFRLGDQCGLAKVFTDDLLNLPK